MESTVDDKLRVMGLSLREHTKLAKELNLHFAAKLLSMAAIEIEMNRHDISQRELDAFCSYVEGDFD